MKIYLGNNLLLRLYIMKNLGSFLFGIAMTLGAVGLYTHNLDYTLCIFPFVLGIIFYFIEELDL